jgi:hypothetical protein
MLSLGALNGTIAIAAATGFFTPTNAPAIALLFMAGPASLTLASLLRGAVQERLLTALLAGVIATALVMIAAGIGPRLLDFVNLRIVKITASIALGAIALLIAGVPIPERTPLIILGVGIATSIIWRII